MTKRNKICQGVDTIYFRMHSTDVRSKCSKLSVHVDEFGCQLHIDPLTAPCQQLATLSQIMFNPPLIIWFDKDSEGDGTFCSLSRQHGPVLMTGCSLSLGLTQHMAHINVLKSPCRHLPLNKPQLMLTVTLAAMRWQTCQSWQKFTEAAYTSLRNEMKML